MQMFSVLSAARSDGFRNSSEFRDKTEPTTLYCFVTIFSLIQETGNIGAVFQAFTRDAVTDVSPESNLLWL